MKSVGFVGLRVLRFERDMVIWGIFFALASSRVALRVQDPCQEPRTKKCLEEFEALVRICYCLVLAFVFTSLQAKHLKHGSMGETWNRLVSAVHPKSRIISERDSGTREK